MQSAWRVIDCTQLRGKLRYARGRLLVCREDEDPVEIPLAQIAVILLGRTATCSTALLFEFAEHGISVMLCDWRGIPVGALHSWSDTPTFVTRRQRAQVSTGIYEYSTAEKRMDAYYQSQSAWPGALPRFMRKTGWE